jgi:hypothetical protein
MLPTDFRNADPVSIPTHESQQAAVLVLVVENGRWPSTLPLTI